MKLWTALRAGGAILAIASALAPLRAQSTVATSEGGEPAIEEITVTARKRAETITETPVAVTAFSAEQLAARRIDSAERLALFTPGLELPNSGASIFSNPVIRGIAQPPLITDETSTAVFVDGVYQSGRTAVAALFDGIERIEVVKGPQSALYGKNSFAGAINYISRRPQLEGFDWVATGTIGTHGRRDIGGGVDLTVVPDRLGFRLDAAHKETGSTWRNAVNGEPLNRVEADTVRASLRWKPLNSLDIFATYQRYEDETSQAPTGAVFANAQRRCQVNPATQRAIPDPANPTTCLFTTPARFETFDGALPPASAPLRYDPRATGTPLELDRTTLVVDADLTEGLTFRSLTGWSRTQNDPVLGIEQSALPLFLNVNIFRSNQSEDREEVSQEFRLAYGRGRFRLEGGVSLYDLDLDIESKTALSPNPFATLPPFNLIVFQPDGTLPVLGRRKETTSTVGVYASAQVDAADWLSLIAEGRQTWEDKAQNITLPNPFNQEGLGRLERNFSYFTPRFIVQVRPADRVQIYASAAKGVKAGGINARACSTVLRSARDPVCFFAPERNWTYEIGAKGSILDGRALVALAAYRVDWTDQQVRTTALIPGPAGIVSVVRNVGETRVEGFEVEGTLRPVEFLTLNAGYSYNDSRYRRAVLSSFNTYPAFGLSGGDVSGNRLPLTSKHNLTLSGDAAHPIGLMEGGELFVRADYFHRSKQFTDESNFAFIGGANVVDLSVGFRSDRLELKGFVSNLTNEDAPLSASRDFGLSGAQVYFQVLQRNERMWGLTLTVRR